MTRLTELEKWPDHTELIFPCDCGGQDYLRITWDERDSSWRSLWIEHDQRPRGWNRVTQSVAALRGRVITHGEVILTDESIKGLYDFLTEKTGD